MFFTPKYSPISTEESLHRLFDFVFMPETTMGSSIANILKNRRDYSKCITNYIKVIFDDLFDIICGISDLFLISFILFILSFDIIDFFFIKATFKEFFVFLLRLLTPDVELSINRSELRVKHILYGGSVKPIFSVVHVCGCKGSSIKILRIFFSFGKCGCLSQGIETFLNTKEIPILQPDIVRIS